MDGRFKFPFFKNIWVHKDQASVFSLNEEFFFFVRLKSIVFGTQRNVVVVVVYIIYIYLKLNHWIMQF